MFHGLFAPAACHSSGTSDSTRRGRQHKAHLCIFARGASGSVSSPLLSSTLPSSPVPAPLSSRCISGIETCLKTVSSDQFPGHRQEGGGETRRGEEAQRCKVRGGSREGPNHVRHYRPPERHKKKKKKKKKLPLRFKCRWQFL